MLYFLGIFFLIINFLNDHAGSTNTGVNVTALIIEALDIYINTVYTDGTFNIIDSVNFVSGYSDEAINKIKGLINVKIPEHYREPFINYLASIKTHENLTHLQEVTNKVPSNNTIKEEFAKNKIIVLHEIMEINEKQTNKIPYIATISSFILVTTYVILAVLTN